MKSIFENVIQRGNYELAGLLQQIDRYHIEGKLTDTDREELVGLAQSGASVKNEVDILAKLTELDSRIRALEKSEATEAYPAYAEGKWYYNGDKCSENGRNYICIAPEDDGSGNRVVCVWPPSQYPIYWKEEE